MPANNNDRRQELKDLIWSAARWVVYGILAAGAVYIVGSLLFGLGNRKPESAQDILTAAVEKGSPSYAVEYQALRRITFHGDELRTATHSTAQVDKKSKAYIVNMAGVSPDGDILHVEHVKGRTIYSTATFGPEWITAPDLSIEEIDAFSPAKMKKMKPTLLQDTGSYRSTRAWIVSLEPSGEQLAGFLWAHHLELMGQTADAELAALRSGQYKLEWAYAWVGYETEQLYAVDIRFKVNKGGDYRIQTKYGSWGTVDLSKLSFRRATADDQ